VLAATVAAGVVTSAGSQVVTVRPVASAVPAAEAAGRSESPAFAALGLQAYEPAKDAPAFALPDLEGRTRRLDDYRGKALLLFFWATW
jgi:hypothetical protein